MKLFGGIEAGGTKFICAIGDESGHIYHEVMIPTKTPKETMTEVIDFFKKFDPDNKIKGYGIGSFGPIDANTKSDTYGYITSTPKETWINYNIVATLKNNFEKPIYFRTDVEASAMGEFMWGDAKNLDHVIYMTIGTGIGIASIIKGQVITSQGNQEGGHIFIPQDKKRDPFEGICPYHKNCLEGLASGPSMKKRWEVESALHLPASHEAWDLEAEYLAYGISNYLLSLSPNRIILGGGVMRQTHLFETIRVKVKEKINGYIPLKNLNDLIVPPGLADKSGVLGAVAFGKLAYEKS